jgi:hypothetical protein
MSKRTALLTLLYTAGFVGSLVFLVWWGINGAMALADQGVDLSLPTVRLDDNQALLLAAFTTATLGILGNWSTRSREARNAEADRIANVALEFYHRMDEIIDWAWQVGSASTKEQIESVQREQEDIRLATLRAKLLPDVEAQTEALVARTDRLQRQLDALRHDLPGSLDHKAREVAYNRVLMFGSAQTWFFARRLSDATLALLRDSTSEQRKDTAQHEALRFLVESREVVVALRKWWGRRWFRTFEFVGRAVFLKSRDAVRVLREPRRAAVPSQEGQEPNTPPE